MMHDVKKIKMKTNTLCYLLLIASILIRMESFSPLLFVKQSQNRLNPYRFKDFSELRSKQSPDNANSPLESLKGWWKEKFSWKSSVLGFIAGVTLSLSIIISPIIQSADILNSVPSLNTDQRSQQDDINQLLQPAVLFQNILFDLRKDYVDPIDPMKLFRSGMKSMLQSLDPYTEFEDLQESKQMQESVSGKYAGVGMVIADIRPPAGMTPTDFQRLYPANVEVVSSFEGYAFDEGIRPGDLILSVNDIDTTRMTSIEVKQLLRGDPNSEVNLKLLRDFSPATSAEASASSTKEHSYIIKEVSFKRSGVQLSDIRLATLIGRPEEGIGYINIAGFNSGLGRDFRNAIYLLRMNTLNDLKGLILDLRDNPGGLLDAAVEIASYLLPENSEIVTSKGRNGQEIVYRSNNNPGSILSKETKLVLLINKGSASAAEILAGAIQDYDAGVIIGTSPSYGKGLVQKIINLPYQSALKYTTAKYYTPSGRCIQEIQYVGGREESTEEVKRLNQLQEQAKNNKDEEASSSSIPIYDPSPVTKYQQSQLGIRNKLFPTFSTATDKPTGEFILPDSVRQTFYTKRLHRTVRDGKGIEPDLILPNTIELSPSEGFLIAEDLYTDFIDHYYLPKQPLPLRFHLSQALMQERITRDAVINYYRQVIMNTLQGMSTASTITSDTSTSTPTALIQLPLTQAITQFLMSGFDNFHHAMILNDIIHVPSMEQFYVLNHHYQNPTINPSTAEDLKVKESNSANILKSEQISPQNLVASVIQTPVDAHFYYGDLFASPPPSSPFSSHPTPSQSFTTYQQFRRDLFHQFQQYLNQRLSHSFSAASTTRSSSSPKSSLQYASLFDNEIQSITQIATLFPSLSSFIQSQLQQHFLPELDQLMAQDLRLHQESITQTLETLLLRKEFPNRLIAYYQLQQDPQVAIAQQLLQSSLNNNQKSIPIQRLSRNGFMYRKVQPEFMRAITDGKQSSSSGHSKDCKEIQCSQVSYEDLLE